MKRSSFVRTLGAAASVALIVTGCAVNGLDFVQDDRVEFVSPDDGETVTLPVEIAWTVKDFDVAEPGQPGGSFALFVDREPMRPGATLDSLADDACENREGCPDENWFNDRRIYPTTDTSVLLERIPARSGDLGGDEIHEAVLVLMDENGRRSGEAAFTLTFELNRERPG